jgi:hypothetical protein
MATDMIAHMTLVKKVEILRVKHTAQQWPCVTFSVSTVLLTHLPLTMNQLAELIDLLTIGELDANERDEIVAQVEDAPNNPDYDFPPGFDAMKIACELVAELGEFAATSDKGDELHEQIQDMFEDDFPDFPFALVRSEGGAQAYVEWLDAELAQRGAEQGGYAAVCLDTGADDTISVFVVYLKDRERVIMLGTLLGLRMTTSEALCAPSGPFG